jgi:hypothetical protein
MEQPCCDQRGHGNLRRAHGPNVRLVGLSHAKRPSAMGDDGLERERGRLMERLAALERQHETLRHHPSDSEAHTRHYEELIHYQDENTFTYSDFARTDRGTGRPTTERKHSSRARAAVQLAAVGDDRWVIVIPIFFGKYSGCSPVLSVVRRSVRECRKLVARRVRGGTPMEAVGAGVSLARLRVLRLDDGRATPIFDLRDETHA